MPADLLFELGCEEIPAKMLTKALADLPAAVEAKLAGARLTFSTVRALGTPRRLAFIVKGLADRQPDLDEEVVGPPVGAAFDKDGALTKAGQGFAAKNGVAPEAIQKKEVPGKKGLYAVARRHVAGSETRGLLPELLRELVTQIAWPKSMRWGWSETAFVRPVQWLVALYGGEVIPLSWAGQTAGRNSRGHRFLSNRPIEIGSADKYIDTLHAANVVVDPEARKTLVRAELARLEKETGFKVRADEALLAEVIHLGEYPVGVSGGFDPSFLEVPEEIIVTAMRTHQRYFAMEDAGGKLAPRFATMMATIVKDPSVVARGNETVLASRLSDAKFFFAEDKKKTFDDWNARLEGVVFQAKLGDGAKTIGHKIERLVKAVENLGGGGVAETAARYAKSDLASHAVGEFPEVQGTMGKHYARIAKLGDEVADAIEQHWWPKGQGAALPRSDAAALIAIADRMDTIVGCFAVGLEPSGSADPFGLRRAAIGIWQILLDRGWSDRYAYAREEAEKQLAAQGVKLKDPKPLDEFFRARLRGMFIEQGIPAQDADAALAQDFTDPVDARARALACAKISKEAREVFKRVANILEDAVVKKFDVVLDEARADDGVTSLPRQAGDVTLTVRRTAPVSGPFPGPASHALPPNPELFLQPDNVEHKLYRAVLEAQQRERDARARRDYAAVFESLELLRPTLAAFFDKGGVMVMDPDPKLRDNRLRLLNWFIKPYWRIADFRLLASTGAA